jgi:hypothetical protein
MYARVSSADIRGGGTTGRTPLSVVVDVCEGDHWIYTSNSMPYSMNSTWTVWMYAQKYTDIRYFLEYPFGNT